MTPGLEAPLRAACHPMPTPVGGIVVALLFVATLWMSARAVRLGHARARVAASHRRIYAAIERPVDPGSRADVRPVPGPDRRLVCLDPGGFGRDVARAQDRLRESTSAPPELP